MVYFAQVYLFDDAKMTTAGFVVLIIGLAVVGLIVYLGEKRLLPAHTVTAALVWTLVVYAIVAFFVVFWPWLKPDRGSHRRIEPQVQSGRAEAGRRACCKSTNSGPTAAQASPSFKRWKPSAMSATLRTHASRGYTQPVSAGKRTADKPAKATDWLVYRLGGARAAFLGQVTAPTREAALQAAFDEFVITSPAERKRIIVQRTSRA
jgi:hypothetical protein